MFKILLVYSQQNTKKSIRKRFWGERTDSKNFAKSDDIPIFIRVEKSNLRI